jgi:hypothetical protein
MAKSIDPAVATRAPWAYVEGKGKAIDLAKVAPRPIWSHVETRSEVESSLNGLFADDADGEQVAFALDELRDIYIGFGDMDIDSAIAQTKKTVAELEQVRSMLASVDRAVIDLTKLLRAKAKRARKRKSKN